MVHILSLSTSANFYDFTIVASYPCWKYFNLLSCYKDPYQQERGMAGHTSNLTIFKLLTKRQRGDKEQGERDWQACGHNTTPFTVALGQNPSSAEATSSLQIAPAYLSATLILDAAWEMAKAFSDSMCEFLINKEIQQYRCNIWHIIWYLPGM